jgi:flavin reductase (DIM6/NTAB) family NADH-FMN oxidoreductase RutF
MPGAHPPEFDCLTGRLDYPMYVVTAAVPEGGTTERSGCLVGFGTQCSIDPPRYLVCISKANHTHRVAVRAAFLVVHFPGPEQIDMARLFGEETGDKIDKFERCAWHPGPDGVTPVLDACPNWFAGRVLRQADGGDHTAFVLEPVAASCPDPDWRMLPFQSVKDLEPGHPA